MHKMKTRPSNRKNLSHPLTISFLLTILVMAGLLNMVPLSQKAWAQKQYAAERAKIELAVPYLDTLAMKRERQRKIFGGAAMGIGIGTGIWGATLMSKGEDGSNFSDYYFGSFLLATGVTYTIGGIIMLAVKTRQEKRRREVISISDPLQRAQAADQTLNDLARRARRGRIIGTGLSIAGITYLMTSDQPDQGLWSFYLAGSTLINLATISLEERTLQNYHKHRQAAGKAELSLGAGIHPSGGGLLQLRIRY